MKLTAEYLQIVRYINRNTWRPSLLRNRLGLMCAYRRRSPIVRAYPRVLQIETTSHCTLKCIMCPRRRMTRPPRHMDIELFRSLIEQSRGRAEIAILHLMGDPLLNPVIHEMVQCCVEAGIRTVISTNGIALSEAAARRLYESKLDIIILSFDGATKATFERVRAGADHDMVITAYRRFLDLQREYSNRVRTIVQMIEFRTTVREKEEFLRFWSDLGAEVVTKPFTHWNGGDAEINALGLDGSTALEHSLCDRAWQWLTVTSDGVVIPCCRDFDATTRLGDLRASSVENIWNGPPFTAFRKIHAQGRSGAEICRRCDYSSVLVSPVAQIGAVAFDEYSLVSLMYDLKYQVDQ